MNRTKALIMSVVVALGVALGVVVPATIAPPSTVSQAQAAPCNQREQPCTTVPRHMGKGSPGAPDYGLWLYSPTYGWSILPPGTTANRNYDWTHVSLYYRQCIWVDEPAGGIDGTNAKLICNLLDRNSIAVAFGGIPGIWGLWTSTDR